jgi:hypothetical protein
MGNTRKNWSIEKGDYQRDFNSTSRYEKKIRRKKFAISFAKYFLLLCAIVMVAYFIFNR